MKPLSGSGCVGMAEFLTMARFGRIIARPTRLSRRLPRRILAAFVAAPRRPSMIRHFGALIPSTNTTCEIEYSHLLPPEYQAHYARMMTSSAQKTPFAPPRDEDLDYQAMLLGTARVELVMLVQTSASLFADDYDEDATRRIGAAAGAPAITSAVAVGRAVKALGARRIALVSPYSAPVNERAGHYFEAKHGLSVVALEGFAATDSYAIGALGPENARAAFARIDRPEIEAFVVPGGNFPTMAHVAEWEAEFNKPVVTTNQALIWAMLRQFGGGGIKGLGRLLDMPA
jgi:maleate cis-trans isomerase